MNIYKDYTCYYWAFCPKRGKAVSIAISVFHKMNDCPLFIQSQIDETIKDSYNRALYYGEEMPLNESVTISHSN